MRLQNLRQADELVDLAMEALADNIPSEQLSEEKIRKIALSLLENPDNLYHHIEVVDDEIVAFSLGYLHDGIFDNRTYATSTAAYIKPAHRGKGLFEKLCQEFESWATNKGADVVNIITFAPLKKILHPRGYQGKELVFVKEVS